MNLFDEIIETLKYEKEISEYSYISSETLKNFYSVGGELCEKIDNNEQRLSKPNVPIESSACTRTNNQDSIGTRPLINKEARDYAQLDMKQLKDTVANCNKCVLCRSRNNTVFGEGAFTADLMLIGEGPGRDEDQQGRPFVGRSGQLLTKMLKAMGFDRKEVFIANIVKCRPPQNRNPHPDEADECMPYLLRQIEIIQPKVLVLLGAVPMKFILNKTGITRVHGQWFEFNGIKTLPTFHPSFLLRDPRQKKHAWNDLQKVMKVLGCDLTH
jgi:uracil-DNA glycosylase